MARIQYEPVSRAQCSREVGEQLPRRLLEPAAPFADQMQVFVLVRGVRRCALPDLGVPQQSELFEQVERPVHGRDVDRRRRLLYGATHAFRGRVAELPHGIEYQLALRGHPQSVLVKRAAQGATVRLLLHGIHPRDGRRPGTLVPMRVLMMVDGTEVDPDTPQLRVDDLGLLRGDGVFETILVSHGKPRELELHLDRLARSAEILELPAPDRAAWQRCVGLVIDRWTGDPEFALKLVYTRGIDGSPERGTTGFALGMDIGERVRRLRTAGVSAVTLERGIDPDLARRAPWLLLGAKSLSYALNMAAGRETERRGADEVIFTASDDTVLEGPTSTVVVANGRTLRTPPQQIGILPGTTQAGLFRAAEQADWSVKTEPVPVADLAKADGVFLASSVRKLTRVHTLDGVALPDSTDLHSELAACYESAY